MPADLTPTVPAALAVRTVARYVTPFREGGSVPALVEGDDGRLWVVKLRGAGQGVLALVAELVAGELARALGLRVPELAFVDIDPALSRSEPNAELQDLLKASVGRNVALAYLPSALTFDPAVRPVIDGALAARMVLFDAFVMNIDRTPRNPNLLWSEGQLWLIDHGAALYFHHDWDGGLEASLRPFKMVRDHVLLPWAGDLAAAAEHLKNALGDEVLARVLALVPDDWLPALPDRPEAAARRAAYTAFLARRRDQAAVFTEEAIRARALRV